MKCKNCNRTGHNSRTCTAPKKAPDASWTEGNIDHATRTEEGDSKTNKDTTGKRTTTNAKSIVRKKVLRAIKIIAGILF